MATHPPDNNNWHDEEDVLVIDQAVGLPDVGTFNLYKITPPLKEREDLDKWIDKVEKILESHNLHNLMSSSLDSDLIEEINGRGNPITFADEFLEEIRKHLKGEGHSALKAAMTAFRSISRKKFSSSDEFIVTLKATYKTLMDLKSRISPYFALQTMLIELIEVPELNSFIVVKDNKLNAIENPVTTITMIDFHRYNTAIQDYIKSTSADSFGIMSAVNNDQQRRQSNNPPNPSNPPKPQNPQNARLTNSPPKGTSP
ncbi:hypothetical protein N7516_007951 [Penicillium verrucosum]|uniref:uncharacterized protein n=1 Tax=Penicillium verrucosum TaxID=60171 RepID=UPI00254534E1|nr:uncharacterized protein N7516_007951 [Penicillium verrucosum]KAJ5926178.1 hypothetical protein N7516_007951 [Penicillium verrucosum]